MELTRHIHTMTFTEAERQFGLLQSLVVILETHPCSPRGV
jgi:hypothetical protein